MVDNQRPSLWPKGPNKFVPMRYEMEAGKNTAPKATPTRPQVKLVGSFSIESWLT